MTQVGRLRPGRLGHLRRRDALRRTKPKWTIDRPQLDGYENVLGYSGTNSKYVKITNPTSTTTAPGSCRTRSTREQFEPTATGMIENNNIFWNNFNYFLPTRR